MKKICTILMLAGLVAFKLALLVPCMFASLIVDLANREELSERIESWFWSIGENL